MAAKKLRKYGVSIPFGASVYVEVEATSKEEALNKALGKADVSLCWSCVRQIEAGEAIEEEAEVVELTK